MNGTAVSSSSAWCRTRKIDSQALVLTSSPGLYLRGPRVLLSASHRLAASLSRADRETVVELAAIISHELTRQPDVQTGDIEAAAIVCLAALRLKSALGRPGVVAAPEIDGFQRSWRDRVRPAKMRLGHVRAVSSTEVEYYFRPTLYSVKDGEHRDWGRKMAGSGQTFRLARVTTDEGLGVLLWAAGRNEDALPWDLGDGRLPLNRAGLFEAVVAEAAEGIEAVEADLLGLDEWRFQEGLRIAFASLSGDPSTLTGS